MAEEGKISNPFNFITTIEIIIGIVLIYYLAKIFGWVSDSAGKGLAIVSKAADQASEKAGYVTSEGQNDPALAYQRARVEYSKAQGYEPGSDEYLNPPGFPDKDTWLKDHPVNTPGYLSTWTTAFQNFL